HEVSRSAGHWKRKLGTRNGASIDGRAPCACTASPCWLLFEVPVRSSIVTPPDHWSPGESDLSGSGRNHDPQNRIGTVRTRCCAAAQLSPLIPAQAGIQGQRTGSPRSRGRAEGSCDAPEHVPEIVIDRVQVLRGLV